MRLKNDDDETADDEADNGEGFDDGDAEDEDNGVEEEEEKEEEEDPITTHCYDKADGPPLPLMNAMDARHSYIRISK